MCNPHGTILNISLRALSDAMRSPSLLSSVFDHLLMSFIWRLTIFLNPRRSVLKTALIINIFSSVVNLPGSLFIIMTLLSVSLLSMMAEKRYLLYPSLSMDLFFAMSASQIIPSS